MQTMFVKDEAGTKRASNGSRMIGTTCLVSEPQSTETVPWRDFMRDEFFGNRV